MTAPPAALPELRRVIGAVADRAAALDSGATDIRADLTALGREGLLGFGVTSADLDQMVQVIEAVSAASLAAGFSSWAQRMTVDYLQRAPASLRERYLPGLLAGRLIGVTAMAAGLRQVAGLGPVPVIAEQVGADLVVSGPIRWASNVFPESVIVVAVRTGDGTSYVVAVAADAPGVTINPAPPLMALSGTASTSLTLQRVRIGPGDIVSGDLHRFVRRIRPAFLLLQTAFCIGIGGAALNAIGAPANKTGQQFQAQQGRLDSTHRVLRRQLYVAASRPDHTPLPELIQLRLAAAATAVDATRLESTLSGGAGYVLGSAANRRFREAAFLPIQSPSEGQLRWELAQYE